MNRRPTREQDAHDERCAADSQGKDFLATPQEMSMTTSASTSASTALPVDDHTTASGQVTWLAVSVFAVTTALTIYGAEHRWEIAIVMAGVLVALLVVYRFLLPRTIPTQRGGGTALVLSVLALVLLLPAFWSGQPLILGAAGVLLGWHSRNSERRGMALTAIIVGAVAAIGYVVIYAADALLPPSAG
jgi:hypothetical protein